VCFWEDDGQDDADADRVRGGPNADLSLIAGRANYLRLGVADPVCIDSVRPPRDDERIEAPGSARKAVLELEPWTIDLPPAWTAVISGDRTLVRLFFLSDAPSEIWGCRIDSRGAEVSFFHHSTTETASAYSEARMRRYIRQGKPEVASILLGGRLLTLYTWTDGIADIDTCFAQVAPGLVLEVHFARAAFEPAAEIGRGSEPTGWAIFRSFKWR
jgi:hypothetical protein